MTCTDFQRAIDLYLDGALIAPVRAAFESHARECASCGTALKHARLLVQALRELPEQTCPERVASRVLERTRMSGARPAALSLAGIVQEFLRTLSLRPATAGWALMILLLIGSYFLSGQIGRIQSPAYTAAEVRQKRVQVDYAFRIFFRTVKKSERFAREEVFESKIIRPVKAGLRHIYVPSSQEGEL